MIFTTRQRSCGKVMFSQMFVCSQGGWVGTLQFVIIKDSVLTYKIIYCKNHKLMLLIQSLNQE